MYNLDFLTLRVYKGFIYPNVKKIFLFTLRVIFLRKLVGDTNGL